MAKQNQPQGATPAGELMTPKEVRELLRVGEDTLYRLGKNGVFSVVRITPRQIRYKRAEVEAYIRLMTRPAVRPY